MKRCLGLPVFLLLTFPCLLAASVTKDSDGIGVLDSATGLEWLPPSVTKGLSYNDAILHPISAIPPGYVLATDAQVARLLLDLGFPPVLPHGTVTVNDGGNLANAFFSLFGPADEGNNATVIYSQPSDFLFYPTSPGLPPNLNLSETVVFGPDPGTESGSAVRYTPDWITLPMSAPNLLFLVKVGQGSCHVSVTKLYQAVDAMNVWQPWACDIYNHPYGTESSRYCPMLPPQFRIAQEGCALTALTMSLNSAGSSFDPGSLNQFMLQPQHANDFGADHGVDFDLTVDDVSSSTGKKLEWNFFKSQSVQDLQNTLCSSGAPIVVGVDLSRNGNNQPVAGHFVLVTGWDGSKFQIADPGYPLRTSLEDYNDQFIGAGYVTDPPGGASLHISVSDAELLVTDPNGLKIGFDPLISQTLDQIPTAAYTRMNLANDETGEPNPQTGYYLDVHAPTTGNYTVNVQGLKLEQFILDVRFFDVNGNPEPPLSVFGVGSPGTSRVFNIQYQDSPGGASTVTAIATFQSTIDDIQNSLALGLIDNAGVANSLVQKIQNALSDTNTARNNVLSAFTYEVTAQAGKHIKGNAPQVLLQDAAFLLNTN